MKSEIKIFENNELGNVRIVMQEGEPWFVAKDVAEALGYTDTTLSNMAKTTQHIPDMWKGRYPIPTPGGEQELLFLSEQGLYFFLGRSDKPKALPYQMWIAGDVVPSIRKHGAYLTEQTLDKILGNPEAFAKLLMQLAEERRLNSALTQTVENQEKALNCAYNLLDAHKGNIRIGQSFSRSNGCMSLGEAARELRQMVAGLQIGRTRFCKWLRRCGYLLSGKNGFNLPSQLSLDAGLMKSEHRQSINCNGFPTVYSVALITRKGLEHFARLFERQNLHY